MKHQVTFSPCAVINQEQEAYTSASCTTTFWQQTLSFHILSTELMVQS